MRRTTFIAVLAVTLPIGLLPVAAGAEEGTHSENLTHVKNLGYEARNGGTPNFGTDIEFAALGGRDYALAGSYRNGLQIVDITEPEQAHIAAIYDCGVTQGDVQVFNRSDHPGRTFITFTSDTFGDGTSTCYREAEALGFDVKKDNGSGKNGTFIADITDPLNPVTVSFVEVAKGSHNQTVHPSGLFLYNSNSDLITTAGSQAIEVYDISDFTAPQLATSLALPLRPGLGTESHDITFNTVGDRAYSAALSQTVIIDTTDPAKPSIVSSFVDPAINVEHQSDPFTLTDAGGNERDFLIVEDEYAGAAGGPHCPSGGVHIYEITGDLEQNPRKVGYWNIGDAGLTPEPTGRCTAHVFDVHEKEAIMTIAFYNGGVRVVDISGLAGYSLGSTPIASEAGMREIAFYKFGDSDTWAAKTPHIQGNGDFYLYGNDISRGLDIFKFDAGNKGGKKPRKSRDEGTWMTASEAAVSLPRLDIAAGYKPFCLLPE
ncbi:MAG: hypothetical protein GEU74_00745 [Nitriliruptorales bacterium]|nr:hypothetical protein [Nitriliruptorales bacterium]